MSSIGTGYDISATTFSPDGRVFQVEYADKAVENSGTAVSIRCTDGVVFGVEKITISKLHVPGSNKRNFSIDQYTGLTFSGLSADARHLVSRARSEASDYRTFYGNDIPCEILAARLAQYMQFFTLYSSVRPFGCSVLLGRFEKNEAPQLYVIEPSGVFYGYKASASGKKKQLAHTELEKLKLDSITCKEAVDAIAKIIHSIHDDVKDKDFELEMSWVCAESNFKHSFIPNEVVAQAEEAAKQALKEDSDDEDMEED